MEHGEAHTLDISAPAKNFWTACWRSWASAISTERRETFEDEGPASGRRYPSKGDGVVVDDDGVSMTGDKAGKTAGLVGVCGEDSKAVVVGHDIEGGGGRAGRWLEGTEDGAGGLKD